MAAVNDARGSSMSSVGSGGGHDEHVTAGAAAVAVAGAREEDADDALLTTLSDRRSRSLSPSLRHVNDDSVSRLSASDDRSRYSVRFAAVSS